MNNRETWLWPSDSQIQRMRNSPPREVCEHGSQKVKCAHCDNIALEAEIASLRAQVDDLRAGQANDDRDHRVLTERAERAEAERDALKQDAERLDWLERLGFSALIGSQYLTARDAIDAARTKENRREED